MKVDAHHHVWNLEVRAQEWIVGEELSALDRSHLPDEYERVARRAGVEASVLVQTVSVPDETPEMLEMAAASPLIAAVTGWVDLTAPNVSETVTALLEHPHARYLTALRAQVQMEDDPRWLCRDDVRAGLSAVAEAGLLAELVSVPGQLPAVVETVRALPDVTFVLDHAGKPDLVTGELDAWAHGIRELGALPNAVCKLSGLVTEADWASWDVATLRPAADVVLESFGSERVMLGSDWPVCRLAGEYDDVLGAYRELLDGLSTTEREDVEGGVASRVYGLAR